MFQSAHVRVLAAVAVALIVASAPASAANTAGNTAAKSGHAPTWSDVAKWPDFTGGQWAIKGSLVNTAGVGAVPLKPELKDKAAAARTAVRGDVVSGCQPHGLPGVVGGEFFYTKNSILLVVDFDYLIFRRIYMDRTDHGDPDPTYFGHSIGHWEGKTLVVDTVGILPEVELGGLPGNGATHIVERYESVDRNTIRLTTTVTNPELLTGPATATKTLVRLPDLDVREAFCQQNDRNAPVAGKASTDLTPPK
jgi:hypothetical protein